VDRGGDKRPVARERMFHGELGPELLIESRQRNLDALRTNKESARGVWQARRDIILRQLSEVRYAHVCWTGLDRIPYLIQRSELTPPIYIASSE
jgi:hypothetical protein